MDISNTPVSGMHRLHGAQKLHGPHRMAAAKEDTAAENSSATMQTRRIQDDIRFSEESLTLSPLDQGSPSSAGVRFELVNRIKAEIAAGTYETPDKMDIALSRMLAR